MKIFLLILLAVPVLLLLVGQMGLLRGQPPSAAPGAHDGQLAPVRAQSLNAVSSQAATEYHRIPPIRITGDPKAAFARLRDIVRHIAGARIVEESDTYLRAECETRALRFVDDFELLLDTPAGIVHVRSASRLGRKDFGVNRARVEALRAAFNSQSGVS